jgi:hypothetical protein
MLLLLQTSSPHLAKFVGISELVFGSFDSDMTRLRVSFH